MKPVNLLPVGSVVAAPTEPVKLNNGLIGGIAIGVVAVLGLGGYLAMARVDSVKSETAQATSAAQAAQGTTTSVRSQIASIGQPVNDSDKQLADGAQQVLVSAFSERYDYVLLTRELKTIMPAQGWYTSVKVDTGGTAGGGGSTGGATVTLEGYMPTVELAASFDDRVTGTKSLSNAVSSQINSKKLTSLATKRPGTYYHFVVTATFEDKIAPSAPGAGSSGSTGTTGTPVANGGDDTISLSLDPEPVVKRTAAQKAAAQQKAAAAAKPKNPFDVAAGAAAGGGS